MANKLEITLPSDREKSGRALQAMLRMKKIIVADLDAAAKG